MAAVPALRLLVVEDDDPIRTALRWALEDEGYDVAEAVSGEEAVRQVSAAAPDLMVVDLTAVHHLSSSAVASLLSAHRTCRARGGAVVLRGANRRVEALLYRTGLWRVIRMEPVDD